jgi:hypothetical protein
VVALVAPTHIVEGLDLFGGEGCVVEFEVGDFTVKTIIIPIYIFSEY